MNRAEAKGWFLALDVGGTRTRAAVSDVSATSPGLFCEDAKPTVRNVQSMQELKGFIHSVMRGKQPRPIPDAAALAFAGPVERHGSVRMTNWEEPKQVDLETLVDWGLPKGGTLLVNDIEAGCLGLSKLMGKREGASEYLESLRPNVSQPEAGQSGNMVYVAPGTGLGAAGLIQKRGDCDLPRHRPIPSEGQHTPIPSLAENQQRALDYLRQTNQGEVPSWEDFVSGRGLVNIYLAFGGKLEDFERGADRENFDLAAAVANAGLNGRDPMAEDALSVYYRCAGAFCQLMALTFQAAGGVFLGGASTYKNQNFIRRSNIVEVFDTNSRQGHLLSKMPFYILKRDPNLTGVLSLAHNNDLFQTLRFSD